MDQETIVKESPLEKAKRLKAEKETKDQAKLEAEAEKQKIAQAKAEKLTALGNQKQDLESQLNEIDSKINASKGEAHETRDTMQEAGLNKDEEFKGEYNTTISEVAGSLNELRNERNRIKAELEKINSDIENFEVDEAIDQGKAEIKGEIETVKQENDQVITEVENYSGVDAGNIEAAKNVVAETNQEVSQVVENSEKSINEVAGENKEKNLSPEIIEKIKRLNGDIAMKEYDVESIEDQAKLYKNRLDFNREFLNKFKDDKDALDKLVEISGYASNAGGNRWKLVKETEEYRNLSNKVQAREKELRDQGQKWDQYRNDSEVKSLETEMRKYQGNHSGELKIGSVTLLATPGEEEVQVYGTSGNIGAEGVMSLSTALNKSIEWHENQINNSEEKVRKINDEIIRLKKEVESLKK